jgi:chondroitin-sulfate-ABC endolyase/exolyase
MESMGKILCIIVLMAFMSSCTKNEKGHDGNGMRGTTDYQDRSIVAGKTSNQYRKIKSQKKLKSDPSIPSKIHQIFSAPKQLRFKSDQNDALQYNFEGETISQNWEWSGSQDISTSDQYFMSGRKSLQLSFNAKDTLILRQPIKLIEKTWNVLHRPGVNAFFSYVRVEKEQPKAYLRCDILDASGKVSGAHQKIKLNFSGWRAFAFSYERDTYGDCPAIIGGLKFSLENSEGGTLWLDQVTPHVVDDHRHQWPDAHVKDINGRDTPVDREWKQRVTLKGDDLKLAIHDIQVVESKLLNWCLSRPSKGYQEMARVCSDYGFGSNGEWKSARPVRMKVQLTHLKPIKKKIDLMILEDYINFRVYQEQMNQLALLYHQTEILEVHKWAKDMYIGMTQHLLHSGFRSGSALITTHHWGYASREWYQSAFLMSHVLEEAGLRADVQKALKYYMREYTPTALSMDVKNVGNQDYLNTTSVSQLITILLLGDDSDVAQWLASFSDFYSNIMLRNSRGFEDGFKIDGCLFRHKGHYPGYGFPALDSSTQMASFLSGSVFSLNTTSLLRLKELLIHNMRATHPEVSLATCGRHPFGGLSYVGLIPSFLEVAYAFQPADQELLAHARRLKEQYGSKVNISEGPVAQTPVGFYSYNHGAYATFWTGGKMVTMKGYNDHVWSSEIYTKDNRYGRYQSHGSLQIQSGKGYKADGHLQDGWDWNRNPGATTVHLPLEMLNSPRKNTTMSHSSSKLAGSVSFKNQAGLFAMKLREGKLENFSPLMRARIFYFCVEDRIYALGDGIGNSREDHETETTLFQVGRKVGEAVVNGQAVTDSMNTSLAIGDQLISPNGHGYLLLEAAELGVHVGKQMSRHNKTMEETQGKFSTAWLKHGKAPSNGSYAYVLFPNGDLDTLASYQTRLSGPNSFFELVRKDRYAHIVKDLDSGITAMALYKSSPEAVGSILEVPQDGLVVFRESKDRLEVSVAHPNLNWDEEGLSQAIPFEFTLEGTWDLKSSVSNAKIKMSNQNTVVQLHLKDGLSIDMVFEKQ